MARSDVKKMPSACLIQSYARPEDLGVARFVTCPPDKNATLDGIGHSDRIGMNAMEEDSRGRSPFALRARRGMEMLHLTSESIPGLYHVIWMVLLCTPFNICSGAMQYPSLQVLEFPVMAESTCNFNGGIIRCTCMPNSLDSLRQANIVRLEFVEAPGHQQRSNV